MDQAGIINPSCSGNSEVGSAAELQRKCEFCTKQESESLKLKVCAKCRVTPYCSKECQKSHWKSHKKVCCANLVAADPDTKKKDVASGPSVNFENQLGTTWLHLEPEEKVFKIIIDTYRMRVEDEYVWCGDVDEDSLYSGRQSGYKGFIKFLNKLERKPHLLPLWWSNRKRAQLIQYAMNKENFSCLYYAVEKSDIQDHYEDSSFPMQLRIFGELVLGPLGS